jgi:hypothetical protein
MEVTTFQGVVENGKIQLGESVKLPEKTVVYVVVPNSANNRIPRIMSPQLVDKSKLADFEREIIEISDDEI